MFGIVEGTNRRGRPCRGWMDDISWCKTELRELNSLAQDRKEWQLITRQAMDTNGRWSHGSWKKKEEERRDKVDELNHEIDVGQVSRASVNILDNRLYAHDCFSFSTSNCNCFELFLVDKRVSESSERRTDRRQRAWYICHRQEHNIGGSWTRLRRRRCMHHLPVTARNASPTPSPDQWYKLSRCTTRLRSHVYAVSIFGPPHSTIS